MSHTKRVGLVAYQLGQLSALSRIHNVFHISMLRKYIPNTFHILDYELLLLRGDLSYEETPILNCSSQKSSVTLYVIPLVKVVMPRLPRMKM